MSVFNKDGGFTEHANSLDRKTKKVMEGIIQDSMDASLNIEEIAYVTYNTICKIALTYDIEKRINKAGKHIND